jgi:LuxR family transcriptional regulator, quorum-sensing system regulator BjaR1
MKRRFEHWPSENQHADSCVRRRIAVAVRECVAWRKNRMKLKSRQHLVFDTIDRIARQTSLAQVARTLVDAVGKFGFTALGVNGLPPPTEGADPYILTESTPEGFRDLYIYERFYSVDHIAVHARTATEVFRYSEAPHDRKKSRDHARFIQALETFGIGRGLVIPIGRPTNLPACVWLAGEDPDFDGGAKRAIELIALYAARKAYSLSGGSAAGTRTVNLTSREREALKWIAAGKTSWEVSMILRLSEKAIDKIIANAMIKLDAVTRAQAVASAIRAGEIEL